ncbi:MAG TPA: ABC transporter substrate-binding protein [Solirubrobacteraceae bacterium]
MKRYIRPVAALLLMAIAALVVSACGSSGSGGSGNSGAGNSGGGTSTSSGGGKSAGGTVQMVMGVFPDSLDPQFGYTTQSAEADWISYTGLTTYKHANGTAGATVIPGLASALPVVTNGGKTYTVTLRKGLKYSNGAPVKAGDFLFSLERAVKLPWGGSGQFMTPVIVGATAYSKGKSKTISGVQANNATGKIVIHLTAPYGAFDNVLAEPALGLIPKGSAPFKNDPLHPPPGCGPYMIKNVVANKSFAVDKNPYWKPLPGIPAGQDNVDVTVNSNVSSNAEQVLNNSADIFDWADSVPGSLLPQIQAKASSRYKLVNLGGSTYYFFMNSQEKPFNNQLAREAVVTGLNETAYSRLGSGTLAPACFFLPPAIPGHPTGACPYGTPGTGNLAKAKALLKKSGMEGAKVTVWTEQRVPRLQWGTAYTQYLNQLGFKATQKEIADATYFQTIGELKLHPQTGFADWNQDFPDPVDFYGVLLDGHAILPTNNENFGEVNDPKINAAVSRLGQVPVTKLQQDSSQWQKIDEYVAKKAYVAVFGYQKFPFFASDRMNYPALKVNPLYGWDFTSFQLK